MEHMTRRTFDAMFGGLLQSIDRVNLADVLLHMRDYVGESVGSKRATRRRKRNAIDGSSRQDRITHGQVRRVEYNAYLLTPEWFSLRDTVMDRDCHTCQCCGNRAFEVHHRSYSPKVMAGNDLTKLVSLCRVCHHKIHYRENGRRKRPIETDVELLDMMKQFAERNSNAENR